VSCPSRNLGSQFWLVRMRVFGDSCSSLYEPWSRMTDRGAALGCSAEAARMSWRGKTFRAGHWLRAAVLLWAESSRRVVSRGIH